MHTTTLQLFAYLFGDTYRSGWQPGSVLRPIVVSEVKIATSRTTRFRRQLDSYSRRRELQLRKVGGSEETPGSFCG